MYRPRKKIMPYTFFQKVSGIFFRSADTFRNLEEERLGAALIHFLKLSALFSLLMTATLYTLPGIPIARRWSLAAQVFQPQDLFVVLLAATIIIPLVIGVWLHVWVYLFGGRRGIGQTLKAALYSYTPFYIIAWIPVIGLFGGAVSTLYPQYVGIRELHHVTSRRAAGAVCAAAFVPVIALFAVIVMALVLPVPMLSFLTAGTGSPTIPDCPYLLDDSNLPESITYYTAAEVESAIIDRDAKEYGCLKEYAMTYAEEKPSSADARRILHFIMLFPPGNATMMVKSEEAFYRGLVPPRNADELPNPGIGDLCISYRIPGLGTGISEYDSYSIVFAKGDVYEKFITVGPSPDYKLLKDLAGRAASRIA